MPPQPPIPQTPNSHHPLSRFPRTLLSHLLLYIPPLSLPSLLLTSRLFSTSLTASLSRQLLTTHFPFVPTTSNPRATFLSLLALRRHLASNSFPEILDLHYPDRASDKERLYHGFHILDHHAGVLVTIESNLSTNEALIRARWLSKTDRPIVTIPAPLELEGGKFKKPESRDGLPDAPPEVFFSTGRIMLLYPRRALRNASTAVSARSLIAVLDATVEGAGATRYHGLLEVSVFPGHRDAELQSGERRRRLGPVFNRHYVAFMNTTRTRVYILRYETGQHHNQQQIPPSLLGGGGKRISDGGSGSRHQEPEPMEVTHYPPSPAAAYDLLADTSGRLLLLLETFPDSENHPHRIVFISALTGVANRQFIVPVAPLYATAPRDWSVSFSPAEDHILIFSSPRDANYRAAMVGQVTVLSLQESAGVDAVKIRYLRAPSAIPPADHIGWDFTTNTAAVISPDRSAEGVKVHLYSTLNLDSKPAGSGAVLNRFNTLHPESVGLIGPPGGSGCGCITSATLGLNWSSLTWSSSHASSQDGSRTVYLLSPRLPAPPPPPPPKGRRSHSRSRPSSWILSSPGTSRPASMVSLGGSSVGGWATPRSVLDEHGGRMVDPREVERRLRGWVQSGVVEDEGEEEEGGARRKWWGRWKKEEEERDVKEMEREKEKEREKKRGLLGIGWRRRKEREKED